jgi:hypothetical protein
MAGSLLWVSRHVVTGVWVSLLLSEWPMFSVFSAGYLCCCCRCSCCCCCCFGPPAVRDWKASSTLCQPPSLSHTTTVIFSPPATSSIAVPFGEVPQFLQPVLVMTAREHAPDFFPACVVSPGGQALLVAKSSSAPPQRAVVLHAELYEKLYEGVVLR